MLYYLNILESHQRKHCFLLIFSLFLSTTIFAQFPSGYGWKVPRKSPKAAVSQTVGVAQIDINYSRPSVKNRKIWGEGGLVPFNKVWRAGSNEATTIRFSSPIKIDTTVVKKGIYALFLLPVSESEAIFILNRRHKQWGAFTYNKKHDVLRAKVSLLNTSHTESLLYTFETLTSDTTVLDISWGKKTARIPITVDLKSTVKSSTKTAFDWQAGFFAAQYYMDELQDYQEALKWTNASLALSKNLSLSYQRAMILGKMEKWEEGIKALNLILDQVKNKSDFRSKNFQQKIPPIIKTWKEKLDK